MSGDSSLMHQQKKVYKLINMSETEDLLQGDYFEAKITCRNKLSRIRSIKSKLTTQQKNLFKNTCFGYWLDLKCPYTDPGYIHFLLQNHISRPDDCNSKEEPEELWFKVTSDYNIRCGRREFCLITGMRFGPHASFKHYVGEDKDNTMPRFASRVLNSDNKYRFKVKDFVNLIYEKGFFSENDEDCVRVAIVCLVQECFPGKMQRDRIDINFLHLPDDFNLMNQFPWGSYIWTNTFNVLRTKVIKKDMGSILTYDLAGFSWAFKMWIWEAYHKRISAFASKTVNEQPRGLQWKRKKRITKFNDYFKLLEIQDDCKTDQLPLQELNATKKESSCNWWIDSVNFFENGDHEVQIIRTEDEMIETSEDEARNEKIEEEALIETQIELCDDDNNKDMGSIINSLKLRINVQDSRIYSQSLMIQELEKSKDEDRKTIRQLQEKIEKLERDSKSQIIEIEEDEDIFDGYVSKSIPIINNLKPFDKNVKVATPMLRRSHRDRKTTYVKRSPFGTVSEMKNAKKNKTLIKLDEKAVVNGEAKVVKEYQHRRIRNVTITDSDIIEILESLMNNKGDLYFPPDLFEYKKPRPEPSIVDDLEKNNTFDFRSVFIKQNNKYMYTDKEFWGRLDGTIESGYLSTFRINSWGNMISWWIRNKCELDSGFLGTKTRCTIMPVDFIRSMMKSKADSKHFSYISSFADGTQPEYPHWSQCGKVLFPMLLTTIKHWILLVLDLSDFHIEIYDSFPECGGGEPRCELVNMLVNSLPEFLKSIDYTSSKEILMPSNYSTKPVPKQKGILGDCGVWVCIHMERIACNISYAFHDDTEAIAKEYRTRMSRTFYASRFAG